MIQKWYTFNPITQRINMKLTELQQRMIDDMLTDYWYNSIKYNPSWEKEFSQLHNFLNKLKEGK